MRVVSLLWLACGVGGATAFKPVGPPAGVGAQLRSRVGPRRNREPCVTSLRPQAPNLATPFRNRQVLVLSAATTSEAGTGVSDSTPPNAATAAAEKKRVLVLMSDTGGGHRASAIALQDAFDTLHPGRLETRIVDVFTDYCKSWPYSQFVDIYKFLAVNPLLWGLVWYGSALPGVKEITDWFMYAACRDGFQQCIDEHDPHMVVSVHPLTQDVPLRILASRAASGSNGSERAQKLAVPFATVVTDLGSAHPTWFHSGADMCFVPTEVLRRVAKGRGLEDSQITTVGLPVRAGFWRQGAPSLPNKETYADYEEQVAVRVALGLEPSSPTVLVVGGGDGVGGIEAVARSLAVKLNDDVKTGPQGSKRQMVVICGKNEEARRNLQDLADSFGQGSRAERGGDGDGGVEASAGFQMVCTGFVSNMDEWMSASDCLVTKAGPGTIAEAAIKGLPVMLSSYLPGQEAGNVDFVKESGFGDYASDGDAIADKISEWFAKPDTLRVMRAAAYAAGRPTATLDVADDLATRALATPRTWSACV